MYISSNQEVDELSIFVSFYLKNQFIVSEIDVTFIKSNEL